MLYKNDRNDNWFSIYMRTHRNSGEILRLCY